MSAWWSGYVRDAVLGQQLGQQLILSIHLAQRVEVEGEAAAKSDTLAFDPSAV